ncbi:MAG: hypothetical protein RR838_13055 [Clostridium sp.]
MKGKRLIGGILSGALGLSYASALVTSVEMVEAADSKTYIAVKKKYSELINLVKGGSITETSIKNITSLSSQVKSLAKKVGASEKKKVGTILNDVKTIDAILTLNVRIVKIDKDLSEEDDFTRELGEKILRNLKSIGSDIKKYSKGNNTKICASLTKKVAEYEAMLRDMIAGLEANKEFYINDFLLSDGAIKGINGDEEIVITFSENIKPSSVIPNWNGSEVKIPINLPKGDLQNNSNIDLPGIGTLTIDGVEGAVFGKYIKNDIALKNSTYKLRGGNTLVITLSGLVEDNFNPAIPTMSNINIKGNIQSSTGGKLAPSDIVSFSKFKTSTLEMNVEKLQAKDTVLAYNNYGGSIISGSSATLPRLNSNYQVLGSSDAPLAIKLESYLPKGVTSIGVEGTTTRGTGVNLRFFGTSSEKIRPTNIDVSITDFQRFMANSNYTGEVTPITKKVTLTLSSLGDGKLYITTDGTYVGDGTLKPDTSNPGTTVVIEDKSLEEIIKRNIQGPDKRLTVENLAKITELDASNSGITSLAGIEYMTGLTRINVSNNNIEKIPSLSALMKLTTFEGSNCGIRNIEGIAQAKNLKKLVLNNNPITNHELLSNLVNMEVLVLNNSNLKNLDFAKSMPWLRGLEVFMNRGLGNIDGIKGCVSLEYFIAYGCSIKDITALGGKTLLSELKLSGNNITDYSPIRPIYNNLQYKDFTI